MDNIFGSVLSYGELIKYSYRLEVFIDKLYKCEDFILCNGSKFKPLKYQILDRSFTSKSDRKILYDSLVSLCDIPRHLRYVIVEGYENKSGKIRRVRNSEISKCLDFGGKPRGFSVRHENRVLTKLQKDLSFLGEVSLNFCSEHYENLIDLRTTKGTPKSDFHFLDSTNNPRLFISHKNGEKPQTFQQYSGVLEFSDHPEIQRFFGDLYKITSGKMPKNMPGYARKIKCQDLKRRAVYGCDFGNQFGINNVQILAQGNMSLKKNTLTAFHIIENPEIPVDAYEPFLYATYRGDRNNGGIENCRMGIYPLGFRNKPIFI